LITTLHHNYAFEFKDAQEAAQWQMTLHRVLGRQIKKPKYCKQKAEQDLQAKRKNKIEQYKQILDDIRATNAKFNSLVYEKEQFEKLNAQNEELNSKMASLLESSQYDSLMNQAKTNLQPQNALLSQNLLQTPKAQTSQD